MKFKKLEVAGFKSFADKLEIKFGQGITAIVGPNGCGKSNVADSIRWVLGEQSAKLLRGSSMQDVIFNGTENRKSLSFCEVNLHFDNSDKMLFPKLDYNEVVISRKLYRSGESEYLLNKTVCRLKDIVDILRDAGMGREGYSIIGQGRIDELLSSKPEDRREIFEEAAGISKFKARKKEAERRLLRTNDDLTRAIDISNEKARALEPLTKQSENARKWLDFRDKLRNYEINTYIYQYDTASEAKGVIFDRLNAILEEIDLRTKESERVTFDYNEAMAAMNSTDKSIDSLREELLVLTVGNEKVRGELNLLNERFGYLSIQNTKLTEENEKLDGEYKSLEEYIALGLKTLESGKKELEEKRIEYENLSGEYLKVIDAITQGEGEAELHHQNVVDAMDKLADIKGNLSRLLAERDALNTKITELRNRVAFNNERLKIETDAQTALQEEIKALVEKREELVRNRDEQAAVNNECLHLINELAVKLDKLNEQYYSDKTRLKMLKDMREAYESFAYSVKKLLADAKDDKNIAKRMEGVVAHLIKVPPQFETAIEMALGNAVQNIVTNNEDDAKFLIEYLKQKKYGRATFSPITSVKPRNIDGNFLPLLKTGGCFGIASDLVKSDEKYYGIIKGLLGGTVIVDNMDTAIELAKKSFYGFKIVTLDGDIINPAGSITGGSKKSELTNIFGYDREIAELEIKLSNCEKDISQFTEKRADLAKKSEAAIASMRAFRDEAHNLDVVLSAKNEAYKKLEGDNAEQVLLIGNLEFEILNDSARVENIDKDLNSVSELENIIKSQKDDAKSGGEERQQKFEVLRNERNTLHELMMSAKSAVLSLENSVFNNDNEIKRLYDNIRGVAEKIEYNASQISENKKNLESIDAQMSAIMDRESQSDSGRSAQIRETLSNLSDFKQEKQNLVASLDEQRMKLVEQTQILYEKKSREDLLLLKVDTDIETMQQRILEEYKLEYNDCLPFKQEDYDLNAGLAESNRLRRQMSALGNINLDAIDQCKIMFEEYNALSVQKDDLQKAKADLEKIISELSAEMLSKFTESFELIRVNFKKIFKELFDGGNADLVLLESDNKLEAGIEIIAQPPEKKLQSISLLSGGERALTAIAILFAILRLKPMPFCVLDEIEAALDDANAARFAKYLRRFSEETQFIVITHRKPTMELSDNLYGVTMEEKGVSKIVSVKLSEAVAVAEMAK